MGTGYAYPMAGAGKLEKAVVPMVFLRRQDASGSETGYQDRRYEPLLQVVSIKWRSGGEHNTATFRMVLSDWNNWTATGPGRIRPEHYGGVVWHDDIVEVAIPYFNPYTGKRLYFSLFIGFVNGATIKINASNESVTFQAVGFEARLADTSVYGQTRRSKTYDDTVLTGESKGYAALGWVAGEPEPADIAAAGDTVAIDEPCVFNPDGLPNRADETGLVEAGYHGSTNVPIFEMVNRNLTYAVARQWELRHILGYLLYGYNRDEQWVINPNVEWLITIMGWPDHYIPSHLEIPDGTALDEAITKAMEDTHFTWTVDPRPVYAEGQEKESGLPTCNLIVFRKGQGLYVDLWLDVPGTSIMESWSNVSSLEVNRKPVVTPNNIVVKGDFKYYQYRFTYDVGSAADSDFIAAWLKSDGDKAVSTTYFDGDGNFTSDQDKVDQFHRRFDTDGAEHYKYRDVFRSYALNEAGEYNGTDYDYGNTVTIYEFDYIFGHAEYARNRRRFYKTIEYEANSPSKKFYNPVLVMSLDGGTNWQEHKNYKLADDEGKITLTDRDLTAIYKVVDGEADDSVNYIQAIAAGNFRFRFVACVRDDRKVEAEAARTSRAASRFTVRRHMDQAKAFRYATIRDETHVIESVANVEHFDDSDKCAAMADELRQVNETGVMDSQIVLPGIHAQLAVGQQVRKIRGREIDLGYTRGSERQYPQIVGIEYVFVGGDHPKHYTRVELDMSHE